MNLKVGSMITLSPDRNFINAGGQNTAHCTLNKNVMLRFGTTHVIGPRVSLLQPFSGKLNGFTVMDPSISLI